MALMRVVGVTVLVAASLCSCVSLPPDRVTAANYALIDSGMTKEQVFAILGPGVQQSETTMGGMTLENYAWSPRDNYSGAQILVTFRDGFEMSKVKVGM